MSCRRQLGRCWLPSLDQMPGKTDQVPATSPEGLGGGFAPEAAVEEKSRRLLGSRQPRTREPAPSRGPRWKSATKPPSTTANPKLPLVSLNEHSRVGPALSLKRRADPTRAIWPVPASSSPRRAKRRSVSLPSAPSSRPGPHMQLTLSAKRGSSWSLRRRYSTTWNWEHKPAGAQAPNIAGFTLGTGPLLLHRSA